MAKYFERPLTSSSKALPHDPKLSEIVTKIDYEMPAALSELIDNSIDANSKNILVRIIRGPSSLDSIFVIDDGVGIASSEFDEAMRYARQREYRNSDTGMYGIGMKSSSLNMAQQLTVISRTAGAQLAGRTWTRDSAKRAEVGIVSLHDCTRVFDDLDGTLPWATWDSGTIIQWSEVDDFERAKGNALQLSKFAQVQALAIERHIGLFFHRVLERKRRPVRVYLDFQDSESREILEQREIEPINPFGYEKSGHAEYPKDLYIDLPNGKKLRATAHIWPKGMKSQNFKIPRGSHAGAAESQGLYVYRNDRLLMAGGWKNIRNMEAHQALARLEIHLADSSVKDIGVAYNKTSVNLPVAVTQGLRQARAKDGTSFDAWIEQAIAVNRKTTKAQPDVLLPLPTRGLPMAVQKAFEQESTKGEEVEIEWKRMPSNQVFRHDPRTKRVVINTQFRDAFNVGGGSGTKSTSLPLTLLVLAIRDLIGKKNTEKSKVLMSSLQRIIWTAIKEQT